MNKIKEQKLEFEIKALAPQETWFDPIGIRFIRNATRRPLNIGFGHNMRAVETIIILESNTEAPQKGAPQILEGEIIEEDGNDI